MTTIAQELGDVLRLLEKATPGPWNYSEKGFSKTPTPTVYATGQDLNYIAMCRDFGNVGPTLNEENAEAIAAAVNFLRTHSAEIAGALRDAERWQPIESAPRDGSEIWAYNGEQARMHWIQGEGYALWVWSDELLSDADPNPEQPTHWRPLPAPPTQESAMQQGGGGGEAAA